MKGFWLSHFIFRLILGVAGYRPLSWAVNLKAWIVSNCGYTSLGKKDKTHGLTQCHLMELKLKKQKNRFMRFSKHRITAVVTNGMINPSSGRLNTGWQNWKGISWLMPIVILLSNRYAKKLLRKIRLIIFWLVPAIKPDQAGAWAFIKIQDPLYCRFQGYTQ